MQKIPVMTNGLRALLPAQLIAFLYLTGVGDRGFIERIKSLMGILAIGRKSTKAEEAVWVLLSSERRHLSSAFTVSFDLRSTFDVGRSMFDVHLYLFPMVPILGPKRAI